ncbi:MAG: putative selenium-dependent hydroxylase accessory protein YqeC [Syntrophomonadaceae bacterium]|nr:putative selenium-dependent hydroxylase accessory protein YqeC [Syntrophomonadaceae bacterium]
MDLFYALDLKEREIISFVGGGGKTTLMFRLADEIPNRYQTLITTTTKIFIPPADRYPTFTANGNKFNEIELKQFLQAGIKPVLGSGLLPENKLSGLNQEQFKNIAQWQEIEYILVEADGSKGRPLKGHLYFEPVIPQWTTMVIIVIGADALGKPLDSDYVHRSEVVTELTGNRPGSVITPEIISKLITHSQGIMRSIPPLARTTVIINKVDCLASLDEAYRTAQLLIGDLIEKVVLCSAISKHPVVDVVYK